MENLLPKIHFSFSVGVFAIAVAALVMAVLAYTKKVDKLSADFQVDDETVTATGAELNAVAGVTKGVGTAGKALVTDGSNSITVESLNAKTLLSDGNTVHKYAKKKYTGSWTGPATKTDLNIVATRFGDMVTLTLQTFQDTSGVNSHYEFSENLDTEFRPLNDIRVPCIIQNGANSNGSLLIKTDGSVALYSDAANGTFFGAAGPVNIGLPYHTEVAYSVSSAF